MTDVSPPPSPPADATGPHTVVGRRERVLAFLLRPTSPPVLVGIALAAALIGAEIALVSILKQVAPENAFGAVFLFGVLVISAGWGFRVSVATSIASAIAYVYFHTSESSESLAPSVLVFLTLALLANLLVGQSRVRALEASQRRREADLSAALARIMVRAPSVPAAFTAAGERLSEVLEIPAPYAVLTGPGAAADPERRRYPLYDGTTPVGTLTVPADLADSQLRRVERMIPSLEALLAAVGEREQLTAALDASRQASHEQLREFARQQSSLRRVATLVARGGQPDELYAPVAHEVAAGLRAEHVSLIRFDPGEVCTVLARSEAIEGHRPLADGEQLDLGGHNAATLIRATGERARVDYSLADGPIAARLRERHLTFAAGVPITVEDHAWGAVIVATAGVAPVSDEMLDRVQDFADLVATAIVNAETRAQLSASRARVIAATDQARRTIERDLHDGAQQRIVTLGLQLRTVEAQVPADLPELGAHVREAIDGLALIHTDLQELSRGIHPAILSRGGLGPALKTLSRRSALPISANINIPGRLPENIEVAAYYAVAESLTNASKHAAAQSVSLSAEVSGAALVIVVADDGIGGAHQGAGSGLVGLGDRIDSAGGQLSIESPPGAGTTITVRLPLPSSEPTG